MDFEQVGVKSGYGNKSENLKLIPINDVPFPVFSKLYTLFYQRIACTPIKFQHCLIGRNVV